MDIPFYDQQRLSEALTHDVLIDGLERAFREEQIITPTRHHHDYVNPGSEKDSTLLLMPSWEEGNSLGVKLVTINPDNQRENLPSIQGVFVLFDKNGTPQILLDAKELTVRRTVATSALASRFLSREESKVLMIIGTGALAPELVKAHGCVRKFDRVMIWGRNIDKARSIVSDLVSSFNIEAIDSIEDGLKIADIVSVATMSKEPLVFGRHLINGQHIDLIGSYRPTMREADDEVVKRSDMYIDSEMAMAESGDLAIPLKSGIIEREDIKGTLFDLCQGKVHGRTSNESITYFKSVGHAMEDLVAARIFWDLIQKQA